MSCKYVIAGTFAVCGLTLAAPALADTKAGIEAWSRGDHAAAVTEWQAAAAKNDADALFDLGQAHKLGRGVAQDLAKAEGFYAQAAAQGHLQAGDNYGLLLFQRGAREQALPYLQTAAGRGDPRAQYLLGIAYFNGSPVAKDWIKGYALVTLSSQQGLAQAHDALSEMARHLSPAQRKQSEALSKQLDAKAKATRTRLNIANDPGDSITGNSTLQAPALLANRTTAPAAALAPARAAADRAAAGRPSSGRLTSGHPPAAGPWRIQLGAFAQAGNADALWNRIRSRPELAGHPRIVVAAGNVHRLQASGFASHDAAETACARLDAAGIHCLPVLK